MECIEMFALDGRVSITMVPSVSKWRKTRSVSPASALEMAALMMRSGELPITMTAFGDPEVACQVAGGNDQTAWLGIQAWGYEGDPEIVAFLSGDMVGEIGRCLHQLYLELMRTDVTDGERSIFTRQVTRYFLRCDHGGNDIADLGSVDPLYP